MTPLTKSLKIRLINHRKKKKKSKLKNIYKKSLAMDFVRAGHDLHHTMRNRSNPKYQIYVLVETTEMIRDLLAIVERDERLYQDRSKK